MGWAEERAQLLGIGVRLAEPALAELSCLIRGCPELAIDVAYCAVHRRMADDGTLWLRCVFGNGHAPVAPGDVIACAEHRQRLDAAGL